jgi:hypothetical protein
MTTVGQPDVTERERPAVEIVARTPTAFFVVEHTRIESFPEQIADGKRFSDLLDVLETVLPPLLPPGSYDVIVQVGATRVVAAPDFGRVRAAIGAWIVATAPKLKLGPQDDDWDDDRPWSITDRPRSVPFEVTLQRAPPDDKVVLHVMRFTPEKLEEGRGVRVGTALARKCPKLAAARQEYEATSILVLESDDIALANRAVIADVVRDGLAERTDVPDSVYLVETDRGLSWQLWVLRDQGRDLEDDDELFGPFELTATR